MLWRSLTGSTSLAVAPIPGLLSNQGEKSINFYFIMVSIKKKVLKYGTPKPRYRVGRIRRGFWAVLEVLQASTLTSQS